MNSTGGGESHIDDFDLFWGMGPNPTEPSKHRDSTSGSMTPSHALSTSIMGSLWSQGNLEAYGHRHHLHANVDMIDGGLASPPMTAAAGSSCRPAPWPSPSPTRASARSRDCSPLRTRLNNHSRSIGSGSTGESVSATTDNLHAVNFKIQELATAITASVVDKLDQSVKDALQVQSVGVIEPPSSSTISPLATTSEVIATERIAETPTEPLLSRVATLEEQIGDIRRALERKAVASPGQYRFSEAVTDNDAPTASARGHHQTSGRGGRGGSGGSGSSTSCGGCTVEQSVSALAQRTGTLEGRHKQVQAKVALLDSAFGSKASDWAQTIRDILVEREAAAAAAGAGGSMGKGGGSRFASGIGKRSNNASVGSAAPYSSQGDDGKVIRGGGTSSVSKRGASIPQPSRETTFATGAPEPLPAGRNSEPGKGGELEVKIDGAARHVPGLVDQKGRGGTNGTSGRSQGTKSGRVPAPQTAASKSLELAEQNLGGANDAPSAQPDFKPAPKHREVKPPRNVIEAARDAKFAALTRCATCVESEERCKQLESRVLETERVVRQLQERAAEAAGHAADAAAAAAAAEVGTSKAAEAAAEAAAAATTATAAAAAIKKDAEASDTRVKAMAAANFTSKSIVEKLASDLKALLERTKKGEDALALVDHGLESMREEVAPLSGSCSALKRLVESYLREKEQAAEMLKGYVTTITREVATITRQYINGLVAPGRPGIISSVSPAAFAGGTARPEHQPASKENTSSGVQDARADSDKQAEPSLDEARISKT